MGQKDLGFLGKAYAIWFFAVPSVMFRLKGVAASGIAVGVKDMWEIMSLYQISRFSAWLLRLRHLHSKRLKEHQTAIA